MRKVFLYLSLISTVCFSAISRDFTYDGLTYTVLSESDKTVETKQGGVVNAGNMVSGDVVIPDIVCDGNGDSYTVIRIGSESFYRCQDITSITLPSTLISIGYEAMREIGVTEIVVPAGVKRIEDRVFSECPNLTTATLECTEVTTDSNVFANCPALESVELNGVIFLSEDFFYHCDKLKEVRLPECLGSIEYRAFANCSSLEYIRIDATTPPTIYSETFNGARKFILSVPVNSVDEYKNSDWAQYANVISSVYTYTYESTSLRYQVLDAEAKTCGVFKYLDSTNENLIIPDKVSLENETYSVVAIAADAFRKCDKFTSVEIPASVKEIGSSVFYDCPNLTTATLECTDVTTGSSVFQFCEALESVKLKGVKNLSSDFFLIVTI